ncbi:hypothetical protein OG21DRAFT_1486934 [Imleria badia]|nr:hypothetical protein OG21DRAFT_1486934 [Imleria badia]
MYIGKDVLPFEFVEHCTASSGGQPSQDLDELCGPAQWALQLGFWIYKAKATRDQGQKSTTTANAQSASCDHPHEDAMTTNPARPLEDPADATGDDEHRPDAPTEPPDMPEGMGGAEATGDDDEQSNEAQVEIRDPADVQVEPGGETAVKRNGSIAHESVDAQANGEVVGAYRNI